MYKKLIYYFTIVLCLSYGLAYLYTSKYYTTIYPEFANTNYGITQISTLMLFRGMSNFTLGIGYCIMALFGYAAIGVGEFCGIVGIEVSKVPDMLQHIFTSYFFIWLKEIIANIAYSIGNFLKPLVVFFVDVIIYSVLAVVFTSPVTTIVACIGYRRKWF